MATAPSFQFRTTLSGAGRALRSFTGLPELPPENLPACGWKRVSRRHSTLAITGQPRVVYQWRSYDVDSYAIQLHYSLDLAKPPQHAPTNWGLRHRDCALCPGRLNAVTTTLKRTGHKNSSAENYQNIFRTFLAKCHIRCICYLVK